MSQHAQLMEAIQGILERDQWRMGRFSFKDVELVDELYGIIYPAPNNCSYLEKVKYLNVVFQNATKFGIQVFEAIPKVNRHGIISPKAIGGYRLKEAA